MIRFFTLEGATYEVDLAKRTFIRWLKPDSSVQRMPTDGKPVSFTQVTSLYPDSPEVGFFGFDGDPEEALFTGRILHYEGDIPSDPCVFDAGKPTLLFRTLNSAYEVDVEERKIRRLSGANAIRGGLGQDGEWRTFADIHYLQVGYRALVLWPERRPADALNTSPIRSIENADLIHKLRVQV